MKYIAIPPGATIKEQLDNKMMSEKDFAVKMGMSEEEIKNLLNGNMDITTDVAEKLEEVLGVPASFWNRFEAIYREKLELIKHDHC